MQPAHPDTPLYTMAAVSRRTGVPAGTLRAWERRYGFPSPQRAPGGQRLYTDRDLQAIASLQSETARGVPISRAIALLLERHSSDGARNSQPRAQRDAFDAFDDASAPTCSPRDDFHRRLLAALLDLAPRRAETALSEALAVLSIEDVCLELIEPVLNEVGDRWHAGQASIAQEHFASAFLRTRVAALLAAYAADDDRPTILAACPQGEWHELGLLMVCLFLARRGMSVRYLGANLPAGEVTRAVVHLRPDLLIVSAQTGDSAERLIAVLREVDALPPPRARCEYGGWIFNQHPALRARTPGVFLGDNARAAADQALLLIRATP